VLADPPRRVGQLWPHAVASSPPVPLPCRVRSCATPTALSAASVLKDEASTHGSSLDLSLSLVARAGTPAMTRHGKPAAQAQLCRRRVPPLALASIPVGARLAPPRASSHRAPAPPPPPRFPLWPRVPSSQRHRREPPWPLLGLGPPHAHTARPLRPASTRERLSRVPLWPSDATPSPSSATHARSHHAAAPLPLLPCNRHRSRRAHGHGATGRVVATPWSARVPQSSSVGHPSLSWMSSAGTAGVALSLLRSRGHGATARHRPGRDPPRVRAGPGVPERCLPAAGAPSPT
jgi:hypothetical protein